MEVAGLPWPGRVIPLPGWSFNFSSCGTPEIPCNFVVLPPDADPDNSGRLGGGTTNAGGGGGSTGSYTPALAIKERYLGYKAFELTNHLGNVITTVSDRKIVQMGDEIINDQFTSGTTAGTMQQCY